MQVTKEYHAQWRAAHPEQVRASQIKYRATHQAKSQAYSRKYYKEHPERALKLRASAIASAERTKREVLTFYGNGKCACVKCGFDNIDALHLDHINDDGYRDRQRVAGYRSSGKWYFRFKKEYPTGYQTLCANCNQIKRIEYCRQHRKDVVSCQQQS